jgi:hypothetical protein
MAIYRVEVAYRTKRSAICQGMQVKAFRPEDAEDYARDKVTKGYPARKVAWITVEEADEQDIARGYYTA